MLTRKIFLTAALLLAACAPSPLYVDHHPMVGAIPRDSRGNAILSEIPPPPAGAPPRALPVPILPPQ